jgi:4-amino-4-deoxy-L-arabinose transferase-like glycosyltransferase
MTIQGIAQIILILSSGFLCRLVFSEDRKGIRPGRFAFISASLSVGLLIVAGFLLALASLFSVWGVIGLEYAALFVAAFIKAGGFAGFKNRRIFSKNIKVFFSISFSKLELKPVFIPLALLFLLLCFLYFRPAEYIHGGFDPGIYINSGVNLAKTGSPFFTDKIVNDLGYEKARRFLGMFTINPLGVSIINQFEGRMASQFYPGLPILYATAYQTAGYDIFLYIQPLIALLSLFALYYLISSVFGKPAAALAVALYSVNLITVWFARYPVAEPLTVLLISAGLYLLLDFYEHGGKFRSVSGGLMLAAALLTRPDAALALLPVSLIGLYRYVWRKWKPGEGWFYIVSFAGFAASIFYAVFYTGGYLRGVFVSFIGVSIKKERALTKAGVLSLLLIIALAVLLVALKNRERIVRFLGRFARVITFIPTAAACILLSLVIFQFFIRPALPFAFLSPQDNSLVRLGWYFAPLGIGWDKIQSIPQPWVWILLKGGILLAAIAAAYAVEKARDYKKALFHLLWIPYALLYFQDLRIEPEHFWLNRRYQMFILVGIIACLSAAAIELWNTRRGKDFKNILFKIVFGLLIAFYAASFLLGTSLIARNKEWKGMKQSLARFDASLPPKCAVIIDGSEPHTLEPLHLPLMTFFGREVSTLKNSSVHLDSLPMMCEKLAKEYGDVIYITPESGRAPRIPGRWGLIGAQKIETKLFETPFVLDYRPPVKAISYALPVKAYIYISKRLRAANGGFVDVGSEGDIYITGDWYGREEYQGLTFRWCGETAGFVTFLEKDAAYIEMIAASGRTESVPPAYVMLLINGREIARFTADPFFRKYRFPVPPGIRGDIELTIKTNPWTPANYGIPDPRRLGLKIDYLKFSY